MSARASRQRPPRTNASMNIVIVCRLTAALLCLGVLHAATADAQVRTEPTDRIQPETIDVAAKKRPKRQGRPARDKIKNKKIKRANEYDVTGGDTLVSTTEFDNHGNAVRKHHKNETQEETEVDTLRDVITKIKDEQRNREMDFEYSDDDTALRVITFKQPNRRDTKLVHGYDDDSRLNSITSEIPPDTAGTAPPGRTATTIHYDGDSDNMIEVEVTAPSGLSNLSAPDRIVSRILNTYESDLLKRQELYVNATRKPEDPDTLVVSSIRTYTYRPSDSQLLTVMTTHPGNPSDVTVETHTYDGDANEIRLEFVSSFFKDDGTGNYVRAERKTVTVRTFDDGLLVTESVEELVDGARLSYKEKRIEYEK